VGKISDGVDNALLILRIIEPLFSIDLAWRLYPIRRAIAENTAGGQCLNDYHRAGRIPGEGDF
jgi:hypothetical protein